MEYQVTKEHLATGHPFKYLYDRYFQAGRKINRILKFTPIINKKILDFGAGSGAFSGRLLEQYGIQSDLYDPSVDSLHRAKQVFPLQGIVSSNLQDFPTDYDLICCWYVYGYIPDKAGFWKLIDSKLASGGYLFLTITNPYGLYSFLTRQSKRPTEDWLLDPTILPPNFTIEKRVRDPWPSYLLENIQTWKRCCKFCIYLFEILFRLPMYHLYVIKKK